MPFSGCEMRANTPVVSLVTLCARLAVWWTCGVSSQITDAPRVFPSQLRCNWTTADRSATYFRVRHACFSGRLRRCVCHAAHNHNGSSSWTVHKQHCTTTTTTTNTITTTSTTGQESALEFEHDVIDERRVSPELCNRVHLYYWSEWSTWTTPDDDEMEECGPDMWETRVRVCQRSKHFVEKMLTLSSVMMNATSHRPLLVMLGCSLTNYSDAGRLQPYRLVQHEGHLEQDTCYYEWPCTHTHVGVVVGIVAASLIFVAAAVTLSYCFCCRRTKEVSRGGVVLATGFATDSKAVVAQEESSTATITTIVSQQQPIGFVAYPAAPPQAEPYDATAANPEQLEPSRIDALYPRQEYATAQPPPLHTQQQPIA